MKQTAEEVPICNEGKDDVSVASGSLEGLEGKR